MKGALEGAGFGLLLGAALGLGAAQATYNPNSDATQNLRYAVYPGALAGLAGIVGAVIGAAISHRTIIEFESQ